MCSSVGASINGQGRYGLWVEVLEVSGRSVGCRVCLDMADLLILHCSLRDENRNNPARNQNSCFATSKRQGTHLSEPVMPNQRRIGFISRGQVGVTFGVSSVCQRQAFVGFPCPGYWRAGRANRATVAGTRDRGSLQTLRCRRNDSTSNRRQPRGSGGRWYCGVAVIWSCVDGVLPCVPGLD